MVTGVGVEFDGGNIDKLWAFSSCLCRVLVGRWLARSMSGGCDRAVVLRVEEESGNRRSHCGDTVSGARDRVGDIATYDLPSNPAGRLCGHRKTDGPIESRANGAGAPIR